MCDFIFAIKNTNKQTKMIVVSFTVSISINAFLNTIIISPIIFIPRTQEKKYNYILDKIYLYLSALKIEELGNTDFSF